MRDSLLDVVLEDLEVVLLVRPRTNRPRRRSRRPAPGRCRRPHALRSRASASATVCASCCPSSSVAVTRKACSAIPGPASHSHSNGGAAARRRSSRRRRTSAASRAWRPTSARRPREAAPARRRRCRFRATAPGASAPSLRRAGRLEAAVGQEAERRGGHETAAAAARAGLMASSAERADRPPSARR